MASDVSLNVTLKPEDGEIVDVGPFRHFVKWAGQSERSTLSYCNECGSALIIEYLHKDGTFKDFCADCHVQQPEECNGL